MVEKQSGHYIKILRTDRGREFVSNDFLSFCKTNGIKRKLTIRYNYYLNSIGDTTISLTSTQIMTFPWGPVQEDEGPFCAR